MKPRAWVLMGGLAALAIWLRFAGLGYGLPQVFNSDEPHLVNLAVSFGSGSLRPYNLKYPTLFPMLAFVCYGAYFAAWSRLGLRHSVGDFAGLFAWDPTWFYLIGRALAAGAGLLALAVVWKAEREERPRARWPWAPLLLAFAPTAVELSHAAKPDMLLLLFSSLAWLFALRVFRSGARRDYWACGASLGLAMASQYTAAACAALLPLAHVLSRRRANHRWLAEGAAAAGVGLFLGAPYVFVDLPRFWASMRDFSSLAAVRQRPIAEVALAVHLNVWNFAGEGSIAGLALALGLASVWRRDRRLACLMAAPIAAYTLSLSAHPDGYLPRYLLAALPGAALLAGEGLAVIEGLGRAAPALALVGALAPGVYFSAIYTLGVLRPDTRSIAQAWMLENIPAGSTLLMDAPHATPMLAMTREEARQLEERTKAAGSPRWRLYAAMADHHPGGGYRILRIQRSPWDLRSNPEHVRLSQAETPTLDVRLGLAAARREGVRYIVTSNFGATPTRSPELKKFFDELHCQAALLKEFAPEYSRTTGPHLRVFRL